MPLWSTYLEVKIDDELPGLRGGRVARLQVQTGLFHPAQHNSTLGPATVLFFLCGTLVLFQQNHF